MRAEIDHVGIAVTSLEKAGTVYERLGLAMGAVEEVPSQKVRVAFVGQGPGRLELLESLAAGSAVARFLERRGEGLHHVAFRVEDVDAEFARMRQGGIRLASDAVHTGAGGHRCFFVHPESAGGVLLEIVGS